ncbi:MAG: Hsp20/alpha crystallin family protein, partial [Gammaproteobacteria bacterium]|nr:Hsp20/alpha crystallin family protein [Gammaproteobacteria bacterium]
MEHMFDEFFPRGWMRPSRWEWPSGLGPGPSFEGRLPRVDVLDRDDAVVVRAEVPGVKKDDLDVSLSERSVTIRGSSAQGEPQGRSEQKRFEPR